MLNVPKGVTDLTGQQFGRLTVKHLERRVEYSPHRYSYHWYCECDCGGHKVVEGSYLRRGSIKSCGCIKPKKVEPRPRRPRPENTIKAELARRCKEAMARPVDKSKFNDDWMFEPVREILHYDRKRRSGDPDE